LRQYDLCRNSGKGAARSPFLLFIQRDTLSALPTRLVVPVMRLAARDVIGDVMIAMEIDGELLHAVVSELFTIGRSALGPPVGNQSDRHDEIVRALDFLVTG
jgi:hypothetical protein